MKKTLVIILLSIVGLAANAQRYSFRTTDFSARTCNYGVWSEWSDWESSNIDVEIDLDKDIVIIHSKSLQVYKIIEKLPAPYDKDGKQDKFRIIDQDMDRGTLRLRRQNNGTLQIYIDFNDISWVYNIVKV